MVLGDAHRGSIEELFVPLTRENREVIFYEQSVSFLQVFTPQ